MADFQKTDATKPLFFLAPVPTILSGNYSIAFLPEDDFSGTSTLKAAEAWEKAGVYLFLNAAQSAIVPADLASRVRRLREGPAWSETRFLWIANPKDPLARWQMSLLPTTRTANGNPILSRATFFDFRNYSLGLSRGSAISLAGDVITITSASASSLSVAGVSSRWKNIGDLRIPLTGAQAGCLRFDLTLDLPEGRNAYADLANLDAGFRVFYKDATRPATDTDYFLRSLSYSFLMEEPPLHQDAVTLKGLYTKPIQLAASLDPVNQLDGARSFFSFFNPGANPELPSCFRTTMGRMVKLRPVDERSRLVFAIKPASTKQGPNDPYYLVPAGDFDVSVKNLDGSAPPATITNRNLLCGLSGVEFVKLTEASTRMSFEPGRPAFATGFVPTAAPAESAVSESQPAMESMEDLLSAGATTSWVYLREQTPDDTPPIYYAQPDQSVFYTRSSASAGDLLEAMEIPSVPLPAGDPPRAFPMLPYGGLDGKNLEDYRQVERNRLSPMRRKTIHDLYANHRLSHNEIHLVAAVPAGSTEPTGVTPQGLLTSFSTDFETWKHLKLARDQFNEELEFPSLVRGAPLRDALQSNKLFLVISQKEKLPALGKADGNVLKIANWGFNFDAKNWDDHGTILIFKSYDKSLQDLVDHPALWTLADQFNRDPQDTRATLARLLREAVAKGLNGTDEEKAKYKPLAEAATNEDWAGILALNLSTPAVESLPSGLAALAAGIDSSKFFAQYFGIETTPVEITATTLDLKPSSLFALIDYNDDSTPASNESGYNFQVNKLTAIFENSHLKSFSSQISVTLDKLFGEDTELIGDNSNRNIVTMMGSVESHDGVDTYSFGFTGDNRFALPRSAAIEEVEILKASFSSDPVTSAAADAPISGRFTFSGSLNFRAWPAGEIVDWKIGQPDHKKTDTTVRIGPRMSDPRIDDLFTVVDDPQPYRVTGFQNGILTFTPAAKTAFPVDAPLRKLALKKSFDILSFGPSDEAKSPTKGLRFSNLVVHMDFRKNAPAAKTFRFDPEKMSFDLQKSDVRPQSLFAKFPLTFQEFIIGDGAKLPATLGYQTVRTPLGGVAPTAPWYGLVFDLDLGSVGSLAGKAGLVVSILAAWTPAKPENGIYVGLRLPGSSGGKKEFSLQGIFKIAFKSIEFLVNPEPPPPALPTNYSYILKLKNIQLKIMVLSLPPKAQTEFIIFGNPKGSLEDRTLGWFAAYQK